MASLAARFQHLDFDTVIRTAFTRRNIKKAAHFSRIALFAILFLVIVFTTRFLFTELFGPSEKLQTIQRIVQQGEGIDGTALDNDQGQDAFSRKDARIIRETKLFGISSSEPTTSTSPPTREEKQAPAETPLPFLLIGTVIDSDTPSVAIIEDKKKKAQEVFAVGESVFDLATLKAIHRSHIELERGGKIETLSLEDTPTVGGDAAPEGAEEIIVNGTELDEALENLPLLLTQARAVPYFKEGKSVGLRLFAIKTDSLYDKIGLKNGDILKTINGKNLGDFSQAMKLFEQLREERNLTLELERNRKPTTFYYTIQ